MVGPREFQVITKKFKFDIHINRNITIISDEGATYKTAFHKILTDSEKRGSGVRVISGDTKVIALTDRDIRHGYLNDLADTDTIVVLDEDCESVHTPEFMQMVKSTGCYFIIITRYLRCISAFSTKEIYRFHSDFTEDLSKRIITLERKYPEMPLEEYIHRQQ